MVYEIPIVPTWAREKPLHISHGLCIFLLFFAIADTSTSPSAEHMLSFLRSWKSNEVWEAGSQYYGIFQYHVFQRRIPL